MPPLGTTRAGVRYAVPRPDVHTLRGVHLAGQLKFFGHHTCLAERKAFAADAARTKDGAVVQALLGMRSDG